LADAVGGQAWPAAIFSLRHLGNNGLHFQSRFFLRPPLADAVDGWYSGVSPGAAIN
jgi:hypothetical protein